jgi:hypothetical protein
MEIRRWRKNAEDRKESTISLKEAMAKLRELYANEEEEQPNHEVDHLRLSSADFKIRGALPSLPYMPPRYGAWTRQTSLYRSIHSYIRLADVLLL